MHKENLIGGGVTGGVGMGVGGGASNNMRSIIMG